MKFRQQLKAKKMDAFDGLWSRLKVTDENHDQLKAHFQNLSTEARRHRRQGRFKEAFDHFYLHKVMAFKLGLESSSLVVEDDEIYAVFKCYADDLQNKGHFDKLWKGYDNVIGLLDKSNNNKMAALVYLDASMKAFEGQFFMKAMEMVDKALDSNKFNIKAIETKERMKSAFMDRWHFSMLNDFDRNDAFKKAISHKNLPESSKVLDIGSGTGLLSLYCASSSPNTVEVVASEASLPIVALAEKILERNPHPGIKLFPHLSTQVKIILPVL